MKKIDKLLLTSFLPPFVVTFFIALFVLIMQTLWVYIDDIIGKGAGLGMIIEFMFYLSISHFIMALPIAVLISSVMVLGNLAEHYELSSMKSAGLSLLRIMRPLMFTTALISVFSWFTANYITPVANLKFKSRLFDMRRQKPALNMEEGVFNDDFEGYRIRIGEKGADNKTLKDVFIANHISTRKDRLNEIIAKGGIMYNTADEQFLVMELEDGQQFQEGNRFSSSRTKAPFVRTSFKKYLKIFDMSEFDINRTDEELFRTHYSMLSMNQLKAAIDSIDSQIANRQRNLGDYLDQYITPIKKDTILILPTENSLKKTSPKTLIEANDSAALANNSIATPDSFRLLKNPIVNKLKEKEGLKPIAKIEANKSAKPSKLTTKERFEQKRKTRTIVDQAAVPTPQTQDKPLGEYSSIIFTFEGHKWQPFIDKAVQQARSIKSNAESGKRFVSKTKEKRVKHVFELHSKYAFAAVCFVFLFVGAPMGALVRKGGFGYPLLIAIIFFMLFITLTMTFKRMAEAFVVPTILAVWLPNLIILPIGFFLTYKAMNDSKVFDSSRLGMLFDNIKSRFQTSKS